LRNPQQNNCINGLKPLAKAFFIVAVGISMLHLTGCTAQVRGRKRPLLQAGRVKGELRLSLEENIDSTKSSSGLERERESSLTSEEIYFENQGAVYHPKLMTYLASIGLGLSQQSFKSEEEDGTYSGSMNSYNLNMNFLSSKPYPFSVNTSKTETLSARPFLSPLRVENTSEGFFLRLRVPEWPMDVTWTENEIVQDSDVVDNADEFFGRKSERLSYTVTHDFNERSHLTFRSDLEDVEQIGGGVTRDIQTDRHRFMHYYKFGDLLQHQLDTNITLVDKAGDFDSRTFDWSESMRLRHSAKFSTFYNVHLSKTTFAELESETIGGTVGFNHKLYENFLTTANVFSNHSEFGSTSETDWYGGNLRFDYTRNNPWGLLSSEYRIDYVNEESTSGENSVLNEEHVFTDGFTFNLNEENVVIDSIRVTDGGSEVYTEGDDYEVFIVGDDIEILGKVTGSVLPNIADGQALFVDYRYQIAGDIQEETLEQYFRIEQAFNNGISIYYSHRTRDRDIESDIEGQDDDEYLADIFGIKYDHAYYTLNAEHSETDSSDNSIVSDQLSAVVSWPMSSRSTVTGRIVQSWTTSRGTTSRENSLFKAEGKIRTRLNRQLKLTGLAEFRDEDNSDIGPVEGFRIGGALEYEYRKLRVKAGWDTYFLNRSNTERDSSRLYVKLYRRF